MVQFRISQSKAMFRRAQTCSERKQMERGLPHQPAWLSKPTRATRGAILQTNYTTGHAFHSPTCVSALPIKVPPGIPQRRLRHHALPQS